jgi:hypothetical protein
MKSACASVLRDEPPMAAGCSSAKGALPFLECQRRMGNYSKRIARCGEQGGER